jgi:hypothetical protein
MEVCVCTALRGQGVTVPSGFFMLLPLSLSDMAVKGAAHLGMLLC